MSIALGTFDGEKAENVYGEEYDRARLLNIRDGLVTLMGRKLSKEDMAVIFKVHPKHIERIKREVRPDYKEAVLAVLSR